MSNRITLASIVGAGHVFLKQLVLQLLMASSLFASNHQYLAHASNARVQGEGDRVTINVKNIALKEVFKMITRQTGMYFMGVGDATETLDRNEKISLSVNNVPLDDVLKILLGRKGYSWVLNNNVITLRKKNDSISDKNNVSDTSSNKLIDLKGTVTNLTGEPLIGATVQVSQTKQATVVDEAGRFSLENVPDRATILISFVGYETKRMTAGKDSDMDVKLQPTVAEMNAVTVISTGYQKIPKERATGSFVHIDNKLLNRRVSSDILSRLNGVTSGLLFDSYAGNDLGINIRGKSTIFANTRPLIILDNFPYQGDINNINPNDVESITVLKDAAASSIWGVRSGNGVIVITTKSGKYDKAVKVSLNTNITLGDKPDLSVVPNISASDYIDVERMLFNEGFYDGRINSWDYQPLSPVIEILNKAKNNEISQSDADAQINALKKYDSRNDFSKYLYRKSLNQQYSLSLSGGGPNQQYYISLGYDKAIANLRGNENDRLTLLVKNTNLLLDRRLEISTDIRFSQTNSKNNAISPTEIKLRGNALYPYARLADDNGKPLAINQHSNNFLDSVGQGKLLDWSYVPLNELNNNDNSSKGTEYIINFGANYKILAPLSVGITYQYGKGAIDISSLYNLQSYYARNYINAYSTIDYQTGNVKYPVPLGGIQDLSTQSYTSQSIRGQLNYSNGWDKSQVNMIAGAELRDLKTTTNGYRQYGFDPINKTNLPVDYVNLYPNRVTGGYDQIQNSISDLALFDRNVSVYANASYTYNDRYTISASARKDASNLFGVNANQKWVPLWSVGASWDMAKESFYNIKWLPLLKIRGTYGYNGNVDKGISAYLISSTSPWPNDFGTIYSIINNPPNPDLRWEKTRMLNIALDFSSVNNIISGSIEYYQKKGTDLMGYTPVAPSAGLGWTDFKGNTADMKGKGVDISIHTKNIDRIFKWESTILFSYANDWVTNYKVKPTTVSNYVESNTNPIEGKPIASLFAYRWAGLDPKTGDPQGILDGKKSKDYSAIRNSTDLASMQYMGSLAPIYSGSIMNTFSFKNVSLSFLITYKLGYYFRRSSINYTNLFEGQTTDLGHSDFHNSWKKPGDEKVTDIPSMIYPADYNRDVFYENSSVLVAKGDHMRLQDIKLSYNLAKSEFRRLPFENMNIYLYANNLGIIWRANKSGMDPDYLLRPGFYNAFLVKNYAVGIKVDF